MLILNNIPKIYDGPDTLSSYYIQRSNVNLNFFASIGYALSSCRKTLRLAPREIWYLRECNRSDKSLPVYITLNTTSLMISRSPKGLGSVFENVEHWLNMFIWWCTIICLPTPHMWQLLFARGILYNIPLVSILMIKESWLWLMHMPKAYFH